MANDETKIAKAVGLGVALAASWLASRVIDGAWKAALGHKPPKAEDEGGDVAFVEIAVAAVITGAVVALARVLAARGTAKLLR